MKLIIDNEYKDPTYIAGVDTSDIDFWPRIYGSSVYGFWESENNDIGPGDLFYAGGSTEMLAGASVRHFRAQNFTVPMVIQTGPSENCGASCYGQIPWYYPQHKTGDSTYVYQLNLRFRLANDIDSVVDGDTLALFYIERTGIPFLEDTVIAMEAPVYLTDNLCSDSLSWSQSLSYVLNVPYCSSFMCHVVYGINFKVKWLKPCDIYIDQVKISTDFGRALWEPQDTAAAFKQIADWANAFFASAPNVLGYYLEDDQSLIVNRDNIPNMRRVDSLMANRLGISPRSLFPEMTLQYKR